MCCGNVRFSTCGMEQDLWGRCMSKFDAQGDGDQAQGLAIVGSFVSRCREHRFLFLSGRSARLLLLPPPILCRFPSLRPYFHSLMLGDDPGLFCEGKRITLGSTTRPTSKWRDPATTTTIHPGWVRNLNLIRVFRTLARCSTAAFPLNHRTSGSYPNHHISVGNEDRCGWRGYAYEKDMSRNINLRMSYVKLPIKLYSIFILSIFALCVLQGPFIQPF
jgi:hypothetical protein